MLLVGWQEGHPACKKLEWWGTGMVICLERDADLHMAQLMPLPLTVSCFRKIKIGFTFLVPAHPGSPRKMAINVTHEPSTFIVWLQQMSLQSDKTSKCNRAVSTWIRLGITVNTNKKLQFSVSLKLLSTVKTLMWSSIAVCETYVSATGRMCGNFCHTVNTCMASLPCGLSYECLEWKTD